MIASFKQRLAFMEIRSQGTDRQTRGQKEQFVHPLTNNKGTKEWNSMYRRRGRTVCGMLIHANGIN